MVSRPATHHPTPPPNPAGQRVLCEADQGLLIVWVVYLGGLAHVAKGEEGEGTVPLLGRRSRHERTLGAPPVGLVAIHVVVPRICSQHQRNHTTRHDPHDTQIGVT